MVRSSLIPKKHAAASATTPCTHAIRTRRTRLAFCRCAGTLSEARCCQGPAQRIAAKSQTTPYLFENKHFKPTWKTAAPAGSATATGAVSFAGGRTTPYLSEKKTLVQPRKAAAQAIPVSRVLCRIIPQLNIVAPLVLHPITLISRTPSRRLFHNWGICHSIGVSNINGRISNSRHINGSGRSSLILWSWPPSCNPH